MLSLRLFSKRDNNKLLVSRLHDETTFYHAFLHDLARCQREVYIESPFITTSRMATLMPILKKLSREGVSITINTRNPKEHEGSYYYQASDAIAELSAYGVTVIYTVRHHRKLAVIDRQITWEGSLNILSQNDSCEMMRRTCSPEIAGQILKFLRVEKFIE